MEDTAERLVCAPADLIARMRKKSKYTNETSIERRDAEMQPTTDPDCADAARGLAASRIWFRVVLSTAMYAEISRQLYTIRNKILI